ncbi:hypothetical protein MEX01_44780 [Methylorubrum extorquens]|nr:hypothetical protein MEX01_44780 [Methylorubrum extorquens]
MRFPIEIDTGDMTPAGGAGRGFGFSGPPPIADGSKLVFYARSTEAASGST